MRPFLVSVRKCVVLIAFFTIAEVLGDSTDSSSKFSSAPGENKTLVFQAS